MKRYMWLALLSLLICSCKKKSEQNNTMYVVIGNGNNITWTTSHVVTYTTPNKEVYIMATNQKTSERITLRLGAYKEQLATYPIYVRSIVADKNSAQYENAKYVLVADGGKIVVSKYLPAGMEGSFDFYDGATRIQGTFTAYKP